MLCYDIVIPFLKQVNEIGDKLFTKLLSMQTQRDQSNCEDNPLLSDCRIGLGHKPSTIHSLLNYPLLVMEMLTLTQLNISLFCSVSKEVMAGCLAGAV